MGDYATGSASDVSGPFPDTGMSAAPADGDDAARGANRAAAREAARRSSMTVPDDVAALVAAAQAVAGAELPAGPGAAPLLLAQVRGLVQLQNVLDAASARAVRAAECAQAAEFDGHRTMRSWLSGHLNLSTATAGRLVRAGRTLEQLPRWAEAAAAGWVTGDQTAVVAKVATPARLAAAVELGADVAGIERDLLACATGAGAEVLPAMTARLLDWIDPDGPEPDPTQRRELHLPRGSGAEGGGGVHGNLDALGFETVVTALTAYQQAGRSKDDDRSHAQQMADALVQLCANALASATTPVLRKNHAHIAVTIPAEDLLDHEEVAGAARLGSGQLVSNGVARQVACDSVITRVLFGPAGMPLDVGRTQRLVPAHIRRAAEARDGGCVFAGCSNPTWWCDAHHVREWIADHGETSVENTALLCERHHTQVHHGYRVRWDPERRRWRTHRPSGDEIVTGYPPGPPVDGGDGAADGHPPGPPGPPGPPADDDPAPQV